MKQKCPPVASSINHEIPTFAQPRGVLKTPFVGPKKLLDYLGRYTHRVAIPNHRLLSLEDGQVEFAYRDRRDGDRRKTMRLSAEEFIRRFLKHTLPSRFMRIQHYGLLANRAKKERLAKCRELLGVSLPEPSELKSLADWVLLWTGEDVTHCPQCGCAEFVTEEIPRCHTLHTANSDEFW